MLRAGQQNNPITPPITSAKCWMATKSVKLEMMQRDCRNVGLRRFRHDEPVSAPRLLSHTRGALRPIIETRNADSLVTALLVRVYVRKYECCTKFNNFLLIMLIMVHWFTDLYHTIGIATVDTTARDHTR